MPQTDQKLYPVSPFIFEDVRPNFWQILAASRELEDGIESEDVQALSTRLNSGLCRSPLSSYAVKGRYQDISSSPMTP